jgi:RNA-directed DNA polymerase
VKELDEIKEKVCAFKSLYKAMYKCKKNVMWKDSVAGYVKNGLVNIYKLRRQLLENNYKIDKYSVFTIYEPKKREIVSTRMKDRVFQRSLSDNYLYDAITKSFIYDNHACQVGKGTGKARDRLACHMQKYFRKNGLDGYVLKCDISNYFGSTSHKVAKDTVRARIDNDWINYHTDKIIESFNQGENPDVGMGLGSQITQLTQLAVLDKMDHMIKERLNIKQYIRYMDDFILIHPDKEYLKYCLEEINNHVNSLNLKLSAKKTQIFPLKQGVKFLGFTFHLAGTGKVIRKLTKENVIHEKKKLKKLKKLADSGVMTKEHVDECYMSWKAHAKQGNTNNLILSMDKFYKNLWKEGKEDV